MGLLLILLILLLVLLIEMLLLHPKCLLTLLYGIASLGRLGGVWVWLRMRTAKEGLHVSRRGRRKRCIQMRMLLMLRHEGWL